ncbi:MULTISPECIES: thioredoxin family protein [Leptospira]|uniref:Thioredoxin family protein n=2 Tax=Leptospira kirschneri TaxID=29507 RepID=A0A1T1DPS4_9LEPT|nr:MULTISPECIES: thioredoxin family protein [Leptospira]EMO78155.1 redoxin [Leptospira kirschneri str. 200801925]EJO71303.1 redoxin [Leptospira kirschneri serovar Grippotyphosa str. RM52]EKO50315.1 redoxin [Leptospira kirschneri str. 200802841]EKP06835.1 redoxin [Leptospira kirschneri str. 2008720114]EKQ85367.1 redoxin [Leptospira kirschneri serovar Grippotyphosa str. Moskva]
MSLLESEKIPLGSLLPVFRLADPNGKTYSSDQMSGSTGLLLIVTCNHCPYAQAIWPRLIRFAGEILSLGVRTVAINPNIHPDYPDDSPEMMLIKIKEWEISFPYLVDETQEVAKKLKAMCTPDIYLYDGEQRLYYHGRMDDNWKNEKQVSRKELEYAVHQLVKGNPAPINQMPSMGCSVKWKE